MCFLAQQAAEKAIKAIFVLLNRDFPYTHDLDRLRDLLPDEWSVKTAHPDLADLSVWAVETRYPGDMPAVVEAEARAAVQKADAVYQRVLDDWPRLAGENTPTTTE